MYTTLNDYISFKSLHEGYVVHPWWASSATPRENYRDTSIMHSAYEYKGPGYTIRTVLHSIPDPIKPFHQPVEHTVYGDQELIIASMHPHPSYRFYSDCCKLNAASYLRDPTIIDAVAINGVFFQFNVDSTPLGVYKQGDAFETMRDVPEAYRPYYRAITISSSGVLAIDPRPFDDVWTERDRHHTIMVSAPLLIDQGRLVVTDEMLHSTTHDDVHIMLCDNSKNGEKGMNLRRGSKTIKSCSNNTPGGLFHIANANPRSAIVTDRSGGVHFVRVAGRMPGRIGMDLVQLGEAILKHIPDAWMALNLDGGAPSQVVHKVADEVRTSANQYSHTGKASTVLVGNLVAYMNVTPEFVTTATIPLVSNEGNSTHAPL